MRLIPYLSPARVFVELDAASNVEVIERLVDRLLPAWPAIRREVLLGALLDRERQVSTGLTGGVAVPHATIDGLDQTALAVARLRRPVDFGSLDGSPVRFVFMILSPPGAIASHIRLLARVARLCSSEGFLDALGQAADATALHRVLEQEDGRHV